MVVVVIAAFTPALDVFISGDDFEWLESAYGVVKDPLSSFDRGNNFFRPFVKWSYLADYLIFGQRSVGYMVTNLLIHFLNVILLFALLRRLLRQPLVAATAATAFALSPLHSEGMLWGAGRPDTILPIFCLGSVLLLDRWCERPSKGLAIAFSGAALLGIGAKESWLIFPIIATGYLVLVRHLPVLAALKRMAVLWVAWAAYVFGFLILPTLLGASTAAHYADFRILPALFKTSSTVFAFLGLGFAPFEAWVAATAVLAGVGVVVWLVRTGNGPGQWAMLWLCASLAVAAPFPVSVLRHNYLPLIGFWMVVAAVVDHALTGILSSPPERRLRSLVPGLLAAAAIAVLTIEGWALQQEIADYRLYGELHQRLCQGYAEIETSISREQPLVLVNRGTLRGVEYVADRVQGTDKTFFVRRDALWQLVFLPPLANFMGRPFDERLEGAGMTEGELVSGAFTVLFFDDTGFSIRPDLRGTLAEAIDAPGGLPPGVSLYRFIEQ